MRKIEGADGSEQVLVQGFRGGEGIVGPYVLLAIQQVTPGADAWTEVQLSLESANVLGEFLRQEAEYAAYAEYAAPAAEGEEK